MPEALSDRIANLDAPTVNDEPPQEKYLFKPFKGSSHHWALNECNKLEPKHRVLDIGCGNGEIGKELRQRGYPHLVAVEPDPRGRMAVADVYDEVYSSFDRVPKGHFGLVMLLDVLEHMQDPFDFLTKLPAMVAPRGQVLISVPNVAHWSVRLPLLFGYFEYSRRGILDRTHLQFFTRRRFRTLLSSVEGFRITSIGSTVSPMQFVLPEAVHQNNFFQMFTEARLKLAQVLPGLCAYQHVAVLTRV